MDEFPPSYRLKLEVIPKRFKSPHLQVLQKELKKSIRIDHFPGIRFIPHSKGKGDRKFITAVATCCYTITDGYKIDRPHSGARLLQQAANWASSHECTAIKDVNTAYRMVLLLKSRGLNFHNFTGVNLEWMQSNDPDQLRPILEQYGLTYSQWARITQGKDDGENGQLYIPGNDQFDEVDLLDFVEDSNGQ